MRAAVEDWLAIVVGRGLPTLDVRSPAYGLVKREVVGRNVLALLLILSDPATLLPTSPAILGGAR